MTVDEKIIKLKKKIEELENKRKELDNKIKESKTELANLENQRNIKLLSQLNDEMSKKGISYDDLLKALQKDDMMSLQVKLVE